MQRKTDQRVRQLPHPNREMICPICMELTDHRVVEEVQQKTIFGIPIRSGARQAIFVCTQCSELHSVSWHEYIAGQGPVAPSEDDLKPARVPRLVIVGALILIAILAAAFLVPIIWILSR